MQSDINEWFRPRPGRCSACTHHLLVLDLEDPHCFCRKEEEEEHGWFPGMHLDHCTLPPSSDQDSCPVFEAAHGDLGTHFVN